MKEAMSRTDPDVDNVSDGLQKGRQSTANVLASNIRDIYDLTGLFTPYIFSPWTAIDVYFLQMSPSGFNPSSGIPNLAGKVILVTGGKVLRH
jgi:hypothetical protein